MRRATSYFRRIAATARVVVIHHPLDVGRPRGRGQRGQTTAEYALVLLGAAGVALLLLGWATQSGAIGRLFDLVMDGVIGKVR